MTLPDPVDDYAMYYDIIPTPIGNVTLVGTETALTFIALPQSKRPLVIAPDWRRDAGPFVAAREQFDAYFDGVLTAFTLPLQSIGTSFQLGVWRELSNIGYGETISYAELARRIGKPTASRAVGLANGANPLSIIVPCHRVIGANGSLTGYGGGIDAKRWLLDHEQRHRPQSFALRG